MTDRDAKGFSTRAIRAASRTPIVDQRPTSVPIYQTATFTSADAEELGRRRQRSHGPATPTRASPTRRAERSATPSPRSPAAEAGIALASGMGAVHAALASQLVGGRPGRRAAGRLRLDAEAPGRRLQSVRGAGRPHRHDRQRGRRERHHRRADEGRLRRDHREPDDRRDRPRDGRRGSPTSTGRPTWSTTRSPRPTCAGRSSSVPTSSSSRRRSSSAATATSSPGSSLAERSSSDGVEAFQNDTGATLGPFDAFLVLRGLLTLGVRMDRHAANAAALGAWLERQDGVIRVLYPGLPSHPQHDVAVASSATASAGGMLAFEVEGGREAGQAIIDALALPELTASLGSVHTFVVHPPSTSQRQLSEEELIAAGSRPGCCACSVGLEDVEDLQADFAQRARGRARRRPRASPSASRGAPLATPAAAAGASAAASAAGAPTNPFAQPARGCGGCSRRSTSPSSRSSSWPVLAVDRDDAPAAARLRLPLAGRLRDLDGDDPHPLRPGPRAGHRQRPRATQRVLDLQVAVFGVAPRRAGLLDRRLHPRSDAAAVAGRSAVRVVQPEPFFDPRLPDRAAMTGVAPTDVGRAMRSPAVPRPRGATEDGSRYVYGDRHRWTKLATLVHAPRA